MKPLAIALSLSCLATMPLASQHSPHRISLVAAGGVELVGIRDNTTFTPAPTLVAGLQIQPRRSLWGMRASTWFYNRDRIGRAQAAGFGLDLIRDFGRGDTRPYATLGLGASWLYYSGISTSGPERDGWSGFGAVGVGILRRLGPAWIFGEARYMRFARGGGFGAHLAPLTVGVRF
jgi:hypothetical protein